MSGVGLTSLNGFIRDDYIVFIPDCAATYSQEDHGATLRNIHRLFGEVVTAGEVAASWKAAPVKAVVS